LNGSLEKYRNISYTKIKQVTVADTAGRMVRNMQVNGADMAQLNIADLQKGIYLVKIISSNNIVETQKLIVQ